jgi:hypothetical protein
MAETWVQLGSNRPLVSETAEKERFRARVAEAARIGRQPSSYWAAEDLAWAFGDGFADELARLDALAVDVRTAELERLREIDEKHELEKEIKRVLVEQEREELRERRARAEVVARERLGLPKAKA